NNSYDEEVVEEVLEDAVDFFKKNKPFKVKDNFEMDSPQGVYQYFVQLKRFALELLQQNRISAYQFHRFKKIARLFSTVSLLPVNTGLENSFIDNLAQKDSFEIILKQMNLALLEYKYFHQRKYRQMFVIVPQDLKNILAAYLGQFVIIPPINDSLN
ncbi:MAG: hypothetical protein WCG27_11000, partial [Pseudomonadota bacterium]